MMTFLVSNIVILTEMVDYLGNVLTMQLESRLRPDPGFACVYHRKTSDKQV